MPHLRFTDVHGKQGLGPIIPKVNVTNGEMENFEVIPLIEQYKDELIIVSLGRLTPSNFVYHVQTVNETN